MTKNDYRRAFIMLRPAATGFSGHARLEQRTMTGSLYLIVTAPTDAAGLSAALAGQRGGEYYAAPIGTLRRDDRGQPALAWNFDPRAVSGRPLEAYQLLVVAQVDGAGCRVVLTGNVDGAYPMDAAAVQDAVCALFAPREPADDLPEPDAGAQSSPDSLTDDGTADLDNVETILPPPSEIIGGEVEAPAPPSEIISGEAEMPARTADDIAGDAEPSESAATDNLASDDSPIVPDGTADNPEGEGRVNPSDARLSEAEPAPSRTRIYTRMRATAPASTLPANDLPSAEIAADTVSDNGSVPADGASGVSTETRITGDSTAAIPEAARRWRAFARDRDAGCGMPLEDGYRYVRVPMPQACGNDYCLVGVRVRDGEVISVRCAVPGPYAPQPPEGLEGSLWIGDALGGYWVFTQSC